MFKILKKIDKYIMINIIYNFLKLKDEWNLSKKEKIFFLKELSYLISWWIWIIWSLNTILESNNNLAIKKICKNTLKYINEWKTLSYSLSRLPDYFNEWDINIIKSWEEMWNLDLVLKSLSQEYSYIIEIKNKYVWALTYPIILIIISFISIIALFSFVLPWIFDSMSSFQWIEIPLITKILINISDFFKTNRQIIIYTLLSLIIILFLFFSTDKWKNIYYKILFSTPIIWKMTKYYFLIKFCRYMKIMFESWMTYYDTFSLLESILDIPPYKEMIENILSGLQKWKTIYDSLKNENELLPSNVISLIKVWEETANLSKSIQNILDIYWEELNNSISSLSKIIEPIMLFFIWFIVLIIALWVFWLILNVMDTVHL